MHSRPPQAMLPNEENHCSRHRRRHPGSECVICVEQRDLYLEVQGLGVMIQHLQDTTDQRYLIDRELSRENEKALKKRLRKFQAEIYNKQREAKEKKANEKKANEKEAKEKEAKEKAETQDKEQTNTMLQEVQRVVAEMAKEQSNVLRNIQDATAILKRQIESGQKERHNNQDKNTDKTSDQKQNESKDNKPDKGQGSEQDGKQDQAQSQKKETQCIKQAIEGIKESLQRLEEKLPRVPPCQGDCRRAKSLYPAQAAPQQHRDDWGRFEGRRETRPSIENERGGARARKVSPPRRRRDSVSDQRDQPGPPWRRQVWEQD